jgi:ribosomal protein L16 Arg81 hydroxylase
LLSDVTKLRAEQADSQAELNRIRLAHADQVHRLQLELLSHQQDFAMDFQQVQSQHERERRKLEKENKRTMKQFEQIREQVKDKERSVKLEIERVLIEWEDKCSDLETREREA